LKIKYTFILLLCSLSPLFAQFQIKYFDNRQNISVYQNGVFLLTGNLEVPLIVGDKIETRESTVEVLSLVDKSIFLLAPFSSLIIENTIESSTSNKKAELLLQKGTLHIIVSDPQITAHAPYLIKTPRNITEISSGELLLTTKNTTTGIQETIIQVDNFSTIKNIQSSMMQILPAKQSLVLENETYQLYAIDDTTLSNHLKTFSFKWLSSNNSSKNIATSQQDIESENLQSPKSSKAGSKEDTHYIDVNKNIDINLKHFSSRLSLGFLTLRKNMYGVLVWSPRIIYKNFELFFHFPFMVEGALDNLQNWYHPFDNFVWSFGADQDWSNDPLTATFDLLNDLFLKIEITARNKNLYFHLGDLENISFGNSISLQDFSNAPYFPQRPRAGMYLLADWKIGGFQLLTEDVSPYGLYAVRSFFHPIKERTDSQIGISLLIDRQSAHEFTPYLNQKTSTFIQEYKSKKLGYLVPGFDALIPLGVRAPVSFFLSTSTLLPFVNDFSHMYLTTASQILKTLSVESGIKGTAQKENGFRFDYLFSMHFYENLALPQYATRYFNDNRVALMRMLYHDTKNTNLFTFAGNVSLTFSWTDFFKFTTSYHIPMVYDLNKKTASLGTEDYFIAELLFNAKSIPLVFSTYFRFQGFIPLLQGSINILSNHFKAGTELTVGTGKYAEITLKTSLIPSETSEGMLLLSENERLAFDFLLSLIVTLKF